MRPLHCLALFGFFLCISLVLFGSAITHDFSTLDDRYLIVQNLFIQGMTLRNIAYVFTRYDPELYIPFTFLSFQINYFMSGLGAWSYHLTNIVLHSANSALVALISWQLTQKRWLAVLAGLLFCVHPLNTEAVVWVAGRKDLLAGFFGLLACSSWQLAISYADHEKRKKRWYWISVGFFLCALLSKASVITLPIVFVLMQYARTRVTSSEKMWKVVKTMMPFFALSLFFGTIAWLGKGRIVHSSTLLETLLMSAKSTVFYLEKLILPIHLNPLYPYHNAITITSPDFFVPLILLGILIGIILYSLKYTPILAAAFLSFFLLLAPSFLNFHKGDITFIGVDRYMYLPMIPLILLAVTGCILLLEYLHNSWMKRGVVIVIAIILALFSVQSFLQTKLWADEELLFIDALKQNPDNIPARMSLSLIYRERGEVNAQESVIQEGLKLREYVGYHLDLASIFLAKGELQNAEREIKKAQALNTKHPDPYFYLASLAEAEQKPDEALQNYRVAYTLDDSYTAAYNNAGAILRDQKKNKEAEQMFRMALKWNPSFFEALMNLAHLLIDHERSAEALPLLQDAFALSSNDADIGNTLAYQLIIAGKKKEAQEVIDAVLRVHPENRTARRIGEMKK